MANNFDVKDAAAASKTIKTTDNAGVHTSHHNVDASALPTGAATETTLAAAAASLSVVDDWDESDRVKVNPIVGQAGVAAGAGAVGATVQRVTVASDDPIVTRLGEVQASPTSNTVLDRLKALLTGIVLAAGANLIGAVKLRPDTANGLTPVKFLDVDESEDEVKGTPGQLYFYHITNLHASAMRYVKFYNDTAANVIVGTTVPVWTIPVRAGTSANSPVDFGIAFSAAICVAATTGFADNDTGAPGNNEVIVNLGYL